MRLAVPAGIQFHLSGFSNGRKLRIGKIWSLQFRPCEPRRFLIASLTRFLRAVAARVDLDAGDADVA